MGIPGHGPPWSLNKAMGRFHLSPRYQRRRRMGSGRREQRLGYRRRPIGVQLTPSVALSWLATSSLTAAGVRNTKNLQEPVNLSRRDGPGLWAARGRKAIAGRGKETDGRPLVAIHGELPVPVRRGNGPQFSPRGSAAAAGGSSGSSGLEGDRPAPNQPMRRSQRSLLLPVSNPRTAPVFAYRSVWGERLPLVACG